MTFQVILNLTPSRQNLLGMLKPMRTALF